MAHDFRKPRVGSCGTLPLSGTVDPFAADTLALPRCFRTVLVPLDGSPFAEHALPLALAIARRARAALRLVNVQPSRAWHRSVTAWGNQDEGGLRYLEGLVRRLAQQTSVPLTAIVAEGSEVAATLAGAAGTGADLVVMATHARGLWGRLWQGSVADALMRRLASPLLLVRGTDRRPDLVEATLPGHVLISLDGTAGAMAMVNAAVALGMLGRATHTLLRVVHPGTPGREEGWPVAAAWPALLRVAHRVGTWTRTVQPRVILDRNAPGDALLRLAQMEEADLIALTVPEVGGLARCLRETVVDRLIRRASTPLLVYRAGCKQQGEAVSMPDDAAFPWPP